MYTTEDGVEIRESLRVRTDDGELGRVVDVKRTLDQAYFDGWFFVLLDSGFTREIDCRRLRAWTT